MDSLLGIGLGSSKGEGKALASRLDQMRKERNDRAKKTTGATNKPSTTSSARGVNPAGQLTFNGLGEDALENDDGMQLITPGGGRGVGSKNKSKNKNKKKKNKR